MSLPEAVVLFGGSGFIGRNIVTALRGRTELMAVTASGRAIPGCAKTVSVATDLPLLPAETAIVHVAGLRYCASRFAEQQAEVLSTNTGLTDAVYRFALARGITEIRVASSCAVYPAGSVVMDDARGIDLNAWPHDGEAAYAWSKRWGEIAAELWRRHAGINTISFRLTNPYGPFDTLDEAEAHVATAFVIRALGKTPEFEIRGDPEAQRDFVFAGDVAAAFVASLDLRGVQDAVNCGYGETTRIEDLALTVMRAAERELPLRLHEAPPGANRGIKARRVTVTGLRRLLPGLAPFRPVAQGMRDTVNWYRDGLS